MQSVPVPFGQVWTADSLSEINLCLVAELSINLVE